MLVWASTSGCKKKKKEITIKKLCVIFNCAWELWPNTVEAMDSQVMVALALSLVGGLSTSLGISISLSLQLHFTYSDSAFSISIYTLLLRAFFLHHCIILTVILSTLSTFTRLPSFLVLNEWKSLASVFFVCILHTSSVRVVNHTLHCFKPFAQCFCREWDAYY